MPRAPRALATNSPAPYADSFSRRLAAVPAPEARKLPHECPHEPETRGISAPGGLKEGVFLPRGGPKRGYFCTDAGASRVRRRRTSDGPVFGFGVTPTYGGKPETEANRPPRGPSACPVGRAATQPGRARPHRDPYGLPPRAWVASLAPACAARASSISGLTSGSGATKVWLNTRQCREASWTRLIRA